MDPEHDGGTAIRFILLMIPKGYEKAPADANPSAEAVAEMMKFNESLHKAGVLLDLEGLRPLSTGARVSFSDGKPMVTDGPFIETREAIGGYWLIQVNSKQEAIQWASRCPVRDDAAIEVRQLQEFEDFPADVRKAVAEFPEAQGVILAARKRGG